MSVRRGLAFRLGVVTVTVALLSVLVAALVTFGLIRGAAQNEGRRQLAREATLVAGLTPKQTTRPALAPRVRKLLVHSGIRLVILGPDGTPRGTVQLAGTDISALLGGGTVSRVETIDGQRVYVEGRPTASGGGIALVQVPKLAPQEQTHFLRRELLALLIGLAVAGLAGVLLARRLARPLQHTADHAHRLAAGDRGVRIEPEGPAEVAEVAEAVNTLARALEASEARQREFLLSVSHELRTPLTAVKGFAEAIADGVTGPENTAATGQVMLTEANRLERLVGDLLDLARLEAQDFRITASRVELRGLVRDAARVWAARCAAADVPFRLEEPDGPMTVVTDPTRVRQIIDGLAENALRVTPAGRPIVLAVRGRPGAAELEVRDGGPGLTPDDFAVAFERSALYARYRGVRKVGTGLGLAIVARLAVRLGGRASAGPAPEGGARFTVFLPWQ